MFQKYKILRHFLLFTFLGKMKDQVPTKQKKQIVSHYKIRFKTANIALASHHMIFIVNG